MKWIFILHICHYLHVVTAIFSQVLDEDKPTITLGSWKENDFHGEWHTNSSPPLGSTTFADSIFVPSTVRGLSLICNANFPIEWKFHRDRWGGRTRLQFALQTNRTSEGLDAKSFSTELSILGFDSSVSGNYSCQKVGYEGLSSSLYIFWEGTSPPYLTLARSYRKPAQIPFQLASKTFTLPCTVSIPTVFPKLYKRVGEKDVELPQNDSINYDARIGYTLTSLKTPIGKYTCQVGEADEDGDGDVLYFDVVDKDDGPKAEFNDTIRHGAFYQMNSTSKEITCCSASLNPPRLRLVECDHPTICALAKHALHRLETSRNKRSNCAVVTMHSLKAGIFRCVGDGIDVVREYFYPIPEQSFGPMAPRRRPRKNDNTTRNSTAPESDPPPPEPYFSWNEASHDKMMLVSKLTRPVYIGQEKTFYCKVSHYYYSQGIVWGIKYSDQEKLEYVGGNMQTPTFRHPGIGDVKIPRHFQILVGNNMATIDITIASNIESLICYAPIWNSTEWGKKALTLDVKVPKEPTVVGGPLIEVAWYLNETNKKLECVFDGEPAPTVLWKKGNQSTALHTSTVNGTSVMQFPAVGIDSQSEYRCVISNVAGNITRRFKVTVLHSSSTMSAALILSLLGFTVVTITLAVVFRYMKSQKSVISHLTNLAFKDVTGGNDGDRDHPSNGNRAPVHIENGGAVLPFHNNGNSSTTVPEKDVSHDVEDHSKIITSPQNNGFSYKNYSSAPEDVSPSSQSVGHLDPFEGFHKL